MLKSIKSYSLFFAKHNFFLFRKIEEINKSYEKADNENFKNQLFIKQIKRAFSKSVFYSNLYNKYVININSIQALEDIDKLPVIDKEIVRENSQQIRIGKKLFTSKGFTSGTTGSPLVVYRSYDSILTENAYLWWYRMKFGLHPKDRKVSIRGDLDRNQLHYFDNASNTLYISSFALNNSNMHKLIPLIKEFRPKGLLGYPSSLYTIACWLYENNKQLSIPLAFTSSETLLQFQEERIVNMFNTTVYDWYGNAERTIALYREDGKYYEPLFYSINEYKSDGVITTSLINNDFPLIRYKVNDKIISQNEYDPIKKSIVIDKIEGRIEDYVLLPDGTQIGRLDVVFKGVRNIKYAQIIQEIKEEINIKVVPIKGYTKEDKQKLEENLRSKLGEEIKLNIIKVKENQIELTKSGKFKLVISKI